MSFRSKTLGLFATAVLASTLFGGTVVAEDTTATLNINPNGVCSASASSSTIDFGTYYWNGTAFVTNTTPVMNFDVTSTYGPGTGCDVSISATNLVKTGDASKIISRDDLVWVYTSGAPTVLYTQGYYLAYGIQLIDSGIGPYSGTIYLNGLYGTNYVVGQYSGTLTFTSVLGTP